jgi:hypothetical protein
MLCDLLFVDCLTLKMGAAYLSETSVTLLSVRMSSHSRRLDFSSTRLLEEETSHNPISGGHHPSALLHI